MKFWGRQEKRLGICAGLGALFAISAVRLSAQSALYVQCGDDAWRAVHEVRENTPLVIQDGNPKLVSGDRFLLRKVDQYVPIFISIRNLKISGRDETLIFQESDLRINEGFEVQADLESAYALDRVFIVLELESKDAGKRLFIQEIGKLAPRRPVPLFERVPVDQHFVRSKLTIHLFTGGMEVLNSEMPSAYRDLVLDQMVSKRIKGVQDAQPKLFVAAPPEYPRELYKLRVNGTAKIRMHIGLNGAVLDPRVTDASAEAFGESALAAVRLWRFLPKIQNGNPVESEVEMPIPFAYQPPEKGG